MTDISTTSLLWPGPDQGPETAEAGFSLEFVGGPDNISPVTAGSGALVASVEDDPYCARELETLSMEVQGFYDLINDPEMLDWYGTEEGREELTQTIGDLIDNINVFVANCGHLLDAEERAQVAKLRGAMDEAARGLNRYEGGDPGQLGQMLNDLGESAVELLRTVGGAAADEGAEIAVDEAKKLGIPIIAMVDTNGNPKKIDYPVPVNDDALSSIELVTSTITDAIKDGLHERKMKKEADKKAAAKKSDADDQAAADHDGERLHEGDEPEARRRADPGERGGVRPGEPARPEHGAEDQRDQHRLAEVGLQHQQPRPHQIKRQRAEASGHGRAAILFGEQPGDKHDEGGFEDFAWLDGKPANANPARGPVHLMAQHHHADEHQHAACERQPRHAPHAGGRESCGDEDHDKREAREDHLLLQIVPGVDGAGDRWARRE